MLTPFIDDHSPPERACIFPAERDSLPIKLRAAEIHAVGRLVPGPFVCIFPFVGVHRMHEKLAQQAAAFFGGCLEGLEAKVVLV